MATKEEGGDYPNVNIDALLASVTLLLENKAYLKIILETQEKILAHLEKKDIKEIMEESDKRFGQHLKQATKEAFEDFAVDRGKKQADAAG